MQKASLTDLGVAKVHLGVLLLELAEHLRAPAVTGVHQQRLEGQPEAGLPKEWLVPEVGLRAPLAFSARPRWACPFAAMCQGSVDVSLQATDAGYPRVRNAPFAGCQTVDGGGAGQSPPSPQSCARMSGRALSRETTRSC